VSWAVLAAAAAPVGGTTLSAGIADSRAQLDQAMGAGGGFGSDSVAHFADAYRASGGGPTLAFLGFNPFQVIATGAFHQMYWAAVVVFLGVMTLVAMQQALRSRYALSMRSPMVVIAQVYFRLMAGVLLITNTPLVYALLMTLNGVLSQGVQAMASGGGDSLLRAGGMGALTFAQARMEAVRGAAARRAVALHPAGSSREEAVQVGLWYNAMAGAINAALAGNSLPGELPLLDASAWNPGSTPDDRVAAAVGRAVVQNFPQMVADLGALPASSTPLSIPFPQGAATPLAPLSASLAADDARAAAALALPATPSSGAPFEAARQLYSKEVLADTLAYLDGQVLPVIGASPTLAQRARGWFSERVEQAAAYATGFMTQWRAAVDWLGRGIGVVLTRMVAFFLNAATGALIEIELFVLVLAMPFWLLPATEDAFHGVLRSLVALSVAVPAYQFIMLFVDALMALVLKVALFGPLAPGAGGGAAAGGAASMAAAAVAVVGSGGEALVLAMFCYLVAYAFLAVYVAVKTPRLVAIFLKGAGAAGAFLSAFATGLVAGGATALSTAAVAGGGGLAGRILGGGARLAGAAGTARGAAASAPRPGPGRYTAPSPATAAPRPRARREPVPAAPPPEARRPASVLRETAGFGLRTFVDCLRADSPSDGLKIALHSLDSHRRQREKETEARHRGRPAGGRLP
jgi:hypothetical protein